MLGWLVAGQLGQEALAFGGLHSDIHPASWQHLLRSLRVIAGHSRVRTARRTTDRRNASEGPVHILWPRSPQVPPVPQALPKGCFQEV